jgi:hypothetical protein
MYTIRNFKTKKALKEAITAGDFISIYQPGGLDKVDYTKWSGTVTLEGPHYPQPHKWYATATIENGNIVKVS